MLVLFSKVWSIKSCNRCPYGARLPEVVDDFIEGDTAEYADYKAGNKCEHVFPLLDTCVVGLGIPRSIIPDVRVSGCGFVY